MCYRPPNSPSGFTDDLHDLINHVIASYSNLPLILLGDFNLPNIRWQNQPPTLQPFSSIASDFMDVCTLFSLTQLITKPTRITQSVSNTLDLVLTSRPDLVSNITYLPGLSDHLLLTFDVNLIPPKKARNTKTIRNYNKANFQAINVELSSFLDIFTASFDSRSVQTNWDMFLCKVNDLTSKYIPVHTITVNPEAPWYNVHLKRLSNKKSACTGLLNNVKIPPVGKITREPQKNI